jgi:hypothetical protein
LLLLSSYNVPASCLGWSSYQWVVTLENLPRVARTGVVVLPWANIWAFHSHTNSSSYLKFFMEKKRHGQVVFNQRVFALQYQATLMPELSVPILCFQICIPTCPFSPMGVWFYLWLFYDSFPPVDRLAQLRAWNMTHNGGDPRNAEP